MQFILVSTIAPLVIYIYLPKLLKEKTRFRWLLLIACLVFCLSWLLPSPKIDGMQTEWFTHFVGGGIFCGLLWLYIKNVKKLKMAWYFEVSTLFALVSSLGVLNELFEFVLYTIDQMPNGIFDTSWDLVSNTTGAMLFYLIYKGVHWSQSAWTK